MKRINVLLCALIMAIGMFAQKGILVMTTPDLGSQYMISSLSPNGKWACGSIYDGIERGFVWNLNTGEIIELSLPGSASAARSVSNDGIVSGSYETTVNTPNNRPILTYGIWEKGVWTSLETENKLNGAWITREGNASTISANGKIIGGIAKSGNAYKPIIWDNGKLNIVHDIEGAVYDVTDDGNMLCGWTTHPEKKNRTSALWKKQADGSYEMTCIDLNSIYAAGPFSVATAFSPNDKYVIACNAVLDVTTGDTIRHDLDYFMSGFELFGVTNDGSAYGFVDNGDYPGGAEKIAVKVSLDRKITNIRDFLIEKGANLDKYPYVQSVMGISEDEKTYALSAYDEYYVPCNIIVRLDVDTHIAPACVQYRELEGLNGISLSWKAPLYTDMIPSGYNVYRDGAKVNTELVNGMKFVETGVDAGKHMYAVTAVYEDGSESAMSEEIAAVINGGEYNEPSQLRAYGSALNDVRLMWNNPYSNLPALRYVTDDDEIAGLGGGDLSFECAIAARPSELELYRKEGYKITEISFVPKSRQSSWTVNFYTKDNDDQPIYSEVIPSENLMYGVVNYHKLNTPVEIPEGKGLIMAISIDVSYFGGYDVIGMNSRKADAGYSDLIRQEGEEDFYSLYDQSMNSEWGAMEYNVRWAMGMHFGKGGEVEDVKKYIISANGEEIGTSDNNMFRVTNLADGDYEFSVVAEYADGVMSAPATVNMNVTADKGMCKTVTPTVVPGDGKAEMSWEAPAAKDNAIITFANDICSGGVLARKYNDYCYSVASIYKGNELMPYEDYEITGLRFYPLNDADFTFRILENNEEIVSVPLERGNDYICEQWNSVELDAPIKINRNSVYMLILDCDNCTPDAAPLGIDSQNGYPEMSDLYSTDGGYSFSSLINNGGKDANWMIGMDIASAKENTLPVCGYNIYLNDSMLANMYDGNSYVMDYLKPDTYTVRVNPVYPNEIGEKESKDVTFVIDIATGVENAENNTFEVVSDATQIMIKGGDVYAADLYAMDGSLAAHSDCNVINISALGEGVYVLNACMDGRTVKTKVVIRR